MRQNRIIKIVFLGLLAIFVYQAVLFTPTAAAATQQETIARNFLKFLHSDKQILSGESIEQNNLDPSLPPVVVAHLFNLQDGGYIIVAPSVDLTPVKAYSLSSDFSELPPAYRTALLNELEGLIRTRPSSFARTTESVIVSETRQRWDFLLNLDISRLPLAYAPDTYLTKTKWNQDYPYNKYTPRMNSQATYTGCVNTAVAQVLRYWKHPAASTGVAAYTWNSQTLKAVLYKTYNWDNMPETLDAATPDYQIDEVASLIADLGIANHTNFDTASSSAYLHPDVLIENFGYSTGLLSMDNSDNNFFAILQSEIDAERVVLLSFPGHMTVADGYASDGAGHRIHVNMGWGGASDNFYYLDRTVQTGSNDFTTNPGDLTIYYNIKPCSGSDCFVNLETGDANTGLSITGKFNYARDADRYDLYLKGPSTIRASRGYSKLFFFIDIFNKADNSLAASVNEQATANATIDLGSLPTGKYNIRISSCNVDGSCYPNTASYDQYTVTLTSSTLTDAEKAAIDQGLDVAPVIKGTFKDLLLNSANQSAYLLLIDARDENGDAVSLQIQNSNPNAVQTSLSNNVLSIMPVAGAVNISAKITVWALSATKSAKQSFNVMVSNEDVGFGKSFEVKGIFANQDDVRQHKVILDGNCSITGQRGFGNQAFFSSVNDLGGASVYPPGDAPINSSFLRNPYMLVASLNGPNISYPLGVNDSYTLNVSCPDADDQTSTIAGLLGIDLSGLYTATYGLTVAKTGNGSVAANTGFIEWNGNTGTADYYAATSVTLTATPASGATFAGWTGACQGKGPCTVITNDAKSVAAVFGMPGDLNNDLVVDLKDAVLGLQILNRTDTSGKTISFSGDTNNDGKIGLPEVIYILQKAAGIR